MQQLRGIPYKEELEISLFHTNPRCVRTHTKRTNAKLYIHIFTPLPWWWVAWCTSAGLLEPIIENALRRQSSCPGVLRLARDLHHL